jgi:hypothetical protein
MKYMHTAINLASSAPYRLKALKVVRFGVVTAKSGRDNEVSLTKIFNTKSQKSCIIANLVKGAVQYPKEPHTLML